MVCIMGRIDAEEEKEKGKPRTHIYMYHRPDTCTNTITSHDPAYLENTGGVREGAPTVVDEIEGH